MPTIDSQHESQHDSRREPRPAAPTAPAPDDCCRSGCAVCVFDLYDDALERYEAQLAAWLARHPEARG